MTRRKNYLKDTNKSYCSQLNEPVAGSFTAASNYMLSLGNREAINRICLEHQVDKLYVFGSAAKRKLAATSDIDFLVKFKDFDLTYYLENFLGLKDNLEAILKREVDLIEHQTIRNPILIRSIEKSKILIYK